MGETEKKAEGRQQSLHVIGIGRTGAVYVEAMLRTGEIEDNLVKDGVTFASLLVDIGDDDIQIANDYARSFKSRLESRKIAADRYHHEAVVLSMPDTSTFAKNLESVRPLHAASGGDGLLAKLPKSFEMPKVGEHTPRALARAIAVVGSYLDDKPLGAALQRFAEQVKRSQSESTVLIAFGLAGGTGSGMALEVGRQLAKLGLGNKVRIVGVGQLSHSGDGDYENSVSQNMALEDIDEAMNGQAAKNPFAGGCFIVSTEHSWQRLTAYTSTGLKEVRQRFKQMVTNRFVADSFMRWVVSDGSVHFDRVLEKAAGKCIMFNVAKFSHPGVQVLPGQPRSTWDAMLQQWIGFVPKYAGLADDFKADFIEAHIFGARYMQSGTMADELKSVLLSNYMKKGREDYQEFNGEFFDELTAYANIVLPGIRKDALTAYKQTSSKGSKDDAAALEKA